MEKALKKKKKVCAASIDLEKVNREAPWEVLNLRGVHGRHLNGADRFYIKVVHV